MKVFVTGGNGFIGCSVVRLLRSANHDVRCLLRPGAQTARIDEQQVERVEGDILRSARETLQPTIAWLKDEGYL